MSGDRRLARRAQRQQRRRWWQGATAAVAGAAILTGLSVVPVASPTLASWVDSEWVGGGFSVLDCAAPEAGTFAAQSQGTLLSGSVLETDLDAIAEVEDALIVNDGTLVQPFDTVFAPLSAEALEAVQLALGNSLQLPLDTQTGLVGQYAQATSTGDLTGASGTITDVGAIALDDPSGGYPELAELKLSQLLKSADYNVGTLLGSNVADVSLGLGAVAGRATLDACDAAFEGITAQTLSREYVASDVTTTVETPAVGELVGGIDGVLSALEGAVNGLASNQSVLSGITNGVSGLLGGVLGSLRLGTISVDLAAEIDLGGVRAFLATPFGDAGGVLTIDPVAGTVVVDTARLLDEAYPGEYSAGLNGLPPNTDLLGDPRIVTALTDALGATLDDWLAQVEALIVSALDAVRVEVDVTVAVRLLLGLLPVAEITASIDATLGDVLAGNAKVATDVRLLGILDLGLLDPLLRALVNGLGGLVGGLVDGVLRPLASLGSTVMALAVPIITAVSNVYNALFLDGIISITINAQNDPATGAGPAEWRDLPPGQYDVSAIRIGVGDALGDKAIALHLGRASVGASCLASTFALEGRCPAPLAA